MIKPIKISVEEREAITYDAMEKFFEQVKQWTPSPEVIFESKVADWFENEYPDVDMDDNMAISAIIDRDKLAIIRNHDYTFGCISRDGMPILLHSSISMKMNNNSL